MPEDEHHEVKLFVVSQADIGGVNESKMDSITYPQGEAEEERKTLSAVRS